MFFYQITRVLMRDRCHWCFVPSSGILGSAARVAKRMLHTMSWFFTLQMYLTFHLTCRKNVLSRYFNNNYSQSFHTMSQVKTVHISFHTNNASLKFISLNARNLKKNHVSIMGKKKIAWTCQAPRILDVMSIELDCHKFNIIASSETKNCTLYPC